MPDDFLLIDPGGDHLLIDGSGDALVLDHLGGVTPPTSPVVTALAPNNGPQLGGTSVTITGVGFTGTTDVTFGTTPASVFTVDADTQITAVAPAGAPGTIDVRVTTPVATSAISAPDHYRYTSVVPAVHIVPSVFTPRRPKGLRYYIGSVGSLQVVDEVELTAASWTPILDRAGTWSATVKTGDPRLGQLLDEWESVIYVGYGDDPPLFGGVVESSKWSSKGWELSGPELIGYLARVFLHDTSTITAMEQVDLAGFLVAHAPDFGATTRSLPGPSTGILRNLAWTPTQLTSILAQLQKLSAFSDGFDFALTLDWGAHGSPGAEVTRTVDFWYPRMGVVLDQTWEHGKAITITGVSRDGTARARRAWVAGASTSTTPALQSADGPLTGPMLEVVLAQKDTTDAAALFAAAEAGAARNARALVTLTADVDVAHPEATFGTWKVGDIVQVIANDVDLVIPSDRFPATEYRITAATFTVADDGLVKVSGATLSEVLPGDPIFRPNGYEDLRQLARRVRTLELNGIVGI
jgi:hypothetical protein